MCPVIMGWRFYHSWFAKSWKKREKNDDSNLLTLHSFRCPGKKKTKGPSHKNAYGVGCGFSIELITDWKLSYFYLFLMSENYLIGGTNQNGNPCTYATCTLCQMRMICFHLPCYLLILLCLLFFLFIELFVFLIQFQNDGKINTLSFHCVISHPSFNLLLLVSLDVPFKLHHISPKSRLHWNCQRTFNLVWFGYIQRKWTISAMIAMQSWIRSTMYNAFGSVDVNLLKDAMHAPFHSITLSDTLMLGIWMMSYIVRCKVLQFLLPPILVC